MQSNRMPKIEEGSEKTSPEIEEVEAPVKKESQPLPGASTVPKRPVVKKPINVVAKDVGYYKSSRKKPGDKFTIEGQHQFSDLWMEKI